MVYGDGIIKVKYSSATGLPLMIDLSDKELEYRWEFQYSNGLLMEERVDFAPKTGLSNAKFIFDYDNNFRLTSVSGRIGGQSMTDYKCTYSIETGKKSSFGQFKVRIFFSFKICKGSVPTGFQRLRSSGSLSYFSHLNL